MRTFVTNKLSEIANRRNIKVDELRFCGFWGANNHYATGWLSQWHMFDITLTKDFTEAMEWRGVGAKEFDQYIVSQPVDEVTLPSAEHAMMYMKAMLFGDEDAMIDVINAESPAIAKAIGRNVKNYDNVQWDKVRYDVVRDINLVKFKSPEGSKILLELARTAAGSNVVFVETSPYDAIWGIKSRKLTAPDDWEGDNLLGFALTDVYDIITRGEV